MKKKNFCELLKSTRIIRILPIWVLILIPAAIVDYCPLNLFLLGFSAALIYGASSIYNAYRDNDYKLPSYFPLIIFFSIFIVIIFSFFNKIILFASLSWIILGILYNTISRYILFGDSFIVGFTHLVIPITASSFLVGLEFHKILSIGLITYFIGFFMTPVSRLKDIEDDKTRGYKTIINIVQKPKIIAIYSFFVTFVFFIFLFYFVGIKPLSFFFLIPLFMIVLILINQIMKENYFKVLDILRIYLISGYLFLILTLTLNLRIIITGFLIAFFYLFILFKKI